jgi:4-amino-4-deoxy-L-arabinose transferase
VKPFHLALLLGFIVCVFMQGSRGIYETTEGRYAECARETLASGNPLEPMLNNHHHWTKPPLTYWAIGAGTALLGSNAWGARAYLVAAFLLTLLAVHALDAALWNRPARGWAALVFATAPMMIATCNSISTDAVLMLWQGWAFACYWLAIRARRRLYMNLMWLALGLAVATKGPVGLLPLAAMLPAQLLLRRRGDAPQPMLLPEGIAVFMAVGLSWYVYVLWRYPEVLQAWIRVEIVGRIEYDAHHRISSQAIKILENYVPIMLLGTGPWLLWWLWSARDRLQGGVWRQTLRDIATTPESLFLLLGIAVQFLVFSLSTSRMPLYLAPLFVLMCAAIGRGIEVLVDKGRLRPQTALRVAVATAVVMMAAKGASAYQSTWKNMSEIAGQLQAVKDIQAGAPLSALFRAPLNGLQFHLDRRIPTFYFRVENPELLKRAAESIRPEIVAVANVDLLPRASDGTPMVPEKSYVIVRSKDLAEFGPYFQSAGLNIVSRGRNWTLLTVDTPIAVTGEAEDTGADDGD